MVLPYSRVPPELWRRMGVNGGVLVLGYDLEGGAVMAENIIGATEGVVTFSARPVWEDFGRGVRNCPGHARELLAVRGWDVRLAGTFKSADSEATRRLLALADIDGTRIAPRTGAALAGDFGDLWYLVDYGGRHGGARPGRYCIHMPNALSTGGLRLRAADGQRVYWPFEFTACVSVEDGGGAFEVFVEPGSD